MCSFVVPAVDFGIAGSRATVYLDDINFEGLEDFKNESEHEFRLKERALSETVQRVQIENIEKTCMAFKNLQVLQVDCPEGVVPTKEEFAKAANLRYVVLSPSGELPQYLEGQNRKTADLMSMWGEINDSGVLSVIKNGLSGESLDEFSREFLIFEKELKHIYISSEYMAKTFLYERSVSENPLWGRNASRIAFVWHLLKEVRNYGIL